MKKHITSQLKEKKFENDSPEFSGNWFVDREFRIYEFNGRSLWVD